MLYMEVPMVDPHLIIEWLKHTWLLWNLNLLFFLSYKEVNNRFKLTLMKDWAKIY